MEMAEPCQPRFHPRDDPLSLEQTVNFRLEYKRDDWQVVIKTKSKLTADATFFYLSNIYNHCRLPNVDYPTETVQPCFVISRIQN